MRILAGLAETRACAWSQIATVAGGAPLAALVPLISVMIFQDGRLSSRAP
jgi:hypothetical protein